MRLNFQIKNLNKTKELAEQVLKHVEAIERIKAQLSWNARTDVSVELIEEKEDTNAASGN